MNWPMTRGTLCIRLISSCARTSSLFRLLLSLQSMTFDDFMPRAYLCSSLMYSSCKLMYLFALSTRTISIGVVTYSRCLCNFFKVEYSSLSSLPIPSMSMLGMFDVVCLLWGGTTFNGFSTATSPMLCSCVISEWRYVPIGKPKVLRCFVQRLRWSASEAFLFVRAVERELTVALF